MITFAFLCYMIPNTLFLKVHCQFITRFRSNYPVILDEDKIIKGVDVHFSKFNLSMIRAYYGIRFASVGKLKSSLAPEYRFQQSVAPLYYEDFSGTKNFDNFQPVCNQNLDNFTDVDDNILNPYLRHIKRIQPFLKNQNEECLTLNIYVPKKNHNDQKMFPVLIFVHGENFQLGSGNIYDLSLLSSFGDIICVTINYRLGIFGFLNLPNGESEGNFALYDLFAAMLWIKNHIKHFNGDPDKITVMGYGDGAVLVHYFTKSKLFQNNNLITIKRLILINGNGAPFFKQTPDYSYIDNIAKQFNQTRKSLLNYLKKVNSSEILRAQIELQSDNLIHHLRPLISGQLFNTNEQTLEDSAFLNMDLWIGVIRNNAGKYFNKIERMAQSEMTLEIFEGLIKGFVNENQYCHSAAIRQIIEHFYTNWTINAHHTSPYVKSDSRINCFNKLLNDAYFFAPAIKIANYHSQFQSRYSTFFHYFDVPLERRENSFDSNADYNDDLALFFGAPLAYPGTVRPFYKANVPSLINISLYMMNQLSTFIKTGNPNLNQNVPHQQGKMVWPLYSHLSKRYLRYYMKGNSPAVSIFSDFMPEVVNFWNNLIPSLCLIPKITQPSAFPSQNDTSVKLVIRYVDVPNDRNLLTAHSTEIKDSILLSTYPVNSRDKLILQLTIAIGSCLVLFNIAIFVGIFYQGRKFHTIKEISDNQNCLSTIKNIHHNVSMNNNRNYFGPQETIPLSIKNNNYYNNNDILDLF